MKESLFDVLVYLFENYMDAEESSADPESLRFELKEAGFPSDDIDKAFNWLEDLATQEPRSDLSLINHQAMRVYVEQEQEQLSTECQGFLLFLEQSGVLDPVSRELVIDRYMALEPEFASLDQLKWVILMVLFNRPGSEAAYAWMEDIVYDNQPIQLH